MSGRRGNGGSGGSADASPFIKPDRLRRSLMRGRRKPLKGAGMKKEENGALGVEVKKEENESKEEEYNEFPLRAISKDSLDNMRIHLLKFQSKKKINPTVDFHLPIRLHRKDTRNLQFQLTRAEIVQRQKEIQDYKKTQQGNDSSHAKKTGLAANRAATPSVPAAGASAVGPSTASTQIATNDEQIPASNSPTANNIATNGTTNISDPSIPTPENLIKKPATDTNDMNIIQTPLEVVGISSDPTKVGMVTYDGREEAPLEDGSFEHGTIDPMADVAPDGGGRVKRGNTSKRKTRQLKVLDENAKKLRFEEFYPWVMEDYDGYNTWVGSYEAGNSDSYVLLSVEDDGSFTMTPADKVYKFTARNKYATLTIEEAEKEWIKKVGEIPRWLMKHLDNIGTTTTRYDRTKRRLKAVADQRIDGAEESEHDDNSEVELDFDEEFADDEEAPIMDGNEQENKESEQRIKKEMLQANAMGLRDEEEHPEETKEDDLFAEKKIDQQGEQIKKALQKTELAALYSDDDDQLNPYLSESDLENPESNKDDDEEKKSTDLSIKKEEGENSDTTGNGKDAISVKKEGSDVVIPNCREPQISVKSIKDCIIILKADKKVLDNFEKGEWNPTTAKRRNDRTDSSIDSTALSNTSGVTVKEESPRKKIKLESDSVNAIHLITEQDIIDAIGDGKVNVKEFGKNIRRQFPGAENKKLMFSIVKKLCRKVDNEHMELKK
ncbi:hypothetical protein TBLA_0H02090 [Henningerozyma blattae CBS 6284]|uniref:Uncharacterized protein n=1 Tax=Henningerozyma blattae (strain ATCC 34711 / CBS 6284 / DSM 70876 / NBRC 10599 / NRRL Y-10934 / UCD 77-7) TaxID=1071380 RepID=I2H7Z3_HENB6|nr:hypothetical protein TBLA_0H02090 [Tetrapisispora blattae CBS 6284]CCH62495.1 hypothetical protein TBLA_0H02090 [Tetrapisispora blattae CBS 6284]